MNIAKLFYKITSSMREWNSPRLMLAKQGLGCCVFSKVMGYENEYGDLPDSERTLTHSCEWHIRMGWLWSTMVSLLGKRVSWIEVKGERWAISIVWVTQIGSSSPLFDGVAVKMLEDLCVMFTCAAGKKCGGSHHFEPGYQYHGDIFLYAR
jgi:hypothetical protein